MKKMLEIRLYNKLPKQKSPFHIFSFIFFREGWRIKWKLNSSSLKSNVEMVGGSVKQSRKTETESFSSSTLDDDTHVTPRNIVNSDLTGNRRDLVSLT